MIRIYGAMMDQAKLIMEKRNANQFPRFFYARHMQPGLAQYLEETILVDTDAMKRMAKTFKGKPVYIGHQTVDLKNLKTEASGYITDSFYNEMDGWLWVEFMAIDDAMYQRIANGDSVSDAYVPTEWGPRGSKNNVMYDREIVNGEFTHLAIVPDPRYESACIFTPDEFKAYQESKRRELVELQNAKDETPKGTSPMFKIFKTKREEVEAPDADAQIEFKNHKGESVAPSVKELIEVYNAKKNSDDEAKKAEDDEEKEKMNEDTEIDVGDGTMVPLKELMNVYCDMVKGADDSKKEMKNAADEAEKVEKAKADKIAKDAAVKKAAELRNANHSPRVQNIDTSLDQVARGQQRYGSSK